MNNQQNEITYLKEKLRESESSRNELENGLESLQESVESLLADFDSLRKTVASSLTEFKQAVHDSDLEDAQLIQKISHHTSLYANFVLHYQDLYQVLLANNKLQSIVAKARGSSKY